jgi:PleD family two-component response regulator
MATIDPSGERSKTIQLLSGDQVGCSSDPDRGEASMRVIVADDEVPLREGLARLLEEAGFEVAGKARDGSEVLAMIERRRPDLVIVDIKMPPTHTDEGVRLSAEGPSLGRGGAGRRPPPYRRR